jgi:hypothetical protein
MGKDEQVIGSNEGGQASGVEGGNAAGAGPSDGQAHAENAAVTVNPSAPGETGTTPGTHGK